MFKEDDIVYCINKKTFYNNTRNTSLDRLELNKPYTIENSNGGNNDVSLKEICDIYFNKTRFISEREYKIICRRKKIDKIKMRINLEK